MDIQELLRQNSEAELLRFTTAGSVDDGKSTLIGRLLSDSRGIFDDQLAAVRHDSFRLNRDEVDLALLMDGLKAEREQGITIDVAYRYFSTPSRRFIIADTPGHEQYTRNMATGASTANLAIILIDASQGVLVQSQRHAFIASLLGIPHLVVAINKMDLVDYSAERFEAIRQAFDAFAARLELKDMVYLPISALKGDNVVQKSTKMPWYSGPSLLDHLKNVHIASDRNLIDFRFPVQYVNRPNATFRGYCGTIASGVIRVGDEVVALPSGRTTKITRILNGDTDVEYAFCPQSPTLCLADELDISRGDMLTHPGNQPRQERQVDAMLVWMSETPMKPGNAYIVKHGANQIRSTLTKLHYRVDPQELHRQNKPQLELNDIGRVSLELYRPLLCDSYKVNRQTGSFILIDPLTNATVAAGMILDRRPRNPVQTETAADARNHLESAPVLTAQRQKLLRQKPATLWLTGLCGAGKSSIAHQLEKRLLAQKHLCAVLDGESLRRGLNLDLGFAANERTENLRRTAEVARLFNAAGLIAIVASISPYHSDRRNARYRIGHDHFIELFIDAPLEVCEKRDQRGLYARARSGELPRFTGISAPYEAPTTPDLHLKTNELTIDQAVDQIIELLQKRGILY